MITTEEFKKMSAWIYEPENKELPSSWNVVKTLNNLDENGLYKGHNSNGYAGALLYNRFTNEYVLVNRGTDKDILPDLIKDDLALMAAKDPEQLSSAQEFFNIAKEYIANAQNIEQSDVTMNLTGHSLGGSLAQLLCIDNCSNIDKATTFNPAGIGHLRTSTSDKITSYICENDIISSVFPQIGELYFSNGPSISSDYIKLYPVLKDIAPGVLVPISIKDNIQFIIDCHEIDNCIGSNRICSDDSQYESMQGIRNTYKNDSALSFATAALSFQFTGNPKELFDHFAVFGFKVLAEVGNAVLGCLDSTLDLKEDILSLFKNTLNLNKKITIYFEDTGDTRTFSLNGENISITSDNNDLNSIAPLIEIIDSNFSDKQIIFNGINLDIQLNLDSSENFNSAVLPSDSSYIVKIGDTLSAIANLRGFSVNELLENNQWLFDDNRVSADRKYVLINPNETIMFPESGNANNNLLIGGKGSSALSGFNGDDTLYGGADNAVDFMYGDQGNDTYIVDQQSNKDIIIDNDGKIMIDGQQLLSANYTSLRETAHGYIASDGQHTYDYFKKSNGSYDLLIDNKVCIKDFISGTFGITTSFDGITVGTEGNDNMQANGNTIYGLAGDDSLSGYGILVGGKGKDIFNLGNLETHAYGDSKDFVSGINYNEYLIGDETLDSSLINADEMNDTFLVNFSGDNYLYGGMGDDKYIINYGADNKYIFDSDGKGSITYKGYDFSNAQVMKLNSTSNLWILKWGSALNEFMYCTYDVISHDLNVWNAFTIKDFSNGMLGITVSDQALLDGGSSSGHSHHYSGGGSFSDPLVLDLNNDGLINTIGVDGSNAYFDIDDDGIAENVGWISPTEGILAYDKNNNGKIDDINELFGYKQEIDGFQELSDLVDENQDGVVDTNDSLFSSLKIWQDKNQDGIAQQEELSSLADNNIASISTNKREVAWDDNGNLIKYVGEYQTIDGETRLAADVFINVKGRDSKYTNDHQIELNAFDLPLLKGSGDIVDLHIAYSKDSTLVDLSRQLQDINSIETFYEKFDSLLTKWIGIDAYYEQNGYVSSELSINDKLWIMEKAVGSEIWQDFIKESYENPNKLNELTNGRKAYINFHFDQYKNHVVKTFFIQSNKLFKGLDYSIASDSFIVSDKNVFNTAISNYVTSENNVNNLIMSAKLIEKVLNNMSDLNFVKDITQMFGEKIALNIDSYTSVHKMFDHYQYITNSGDSIFLSSDSSQELYGTNLDDKIYGSAGYNSIWGNDGNDAIYAGAESDIVNGGNGNDEIYGGEGNDSLYGDVGNDTFYYKSGDGSDLIVDNQGQNVINFLDINYADVNLELSAKDLLIKNLNGDTLIKVRDYVINNSERSISAIIFSDNQQLLSTDIDVLFPNLQIGHDSGQVIFATNNDDIVITGDGKDTIYANAGNDIIMTGGENDTVFANEGNDTIYSGLGNDTIYANQGNNSIYGEDGDDKIYAGSGHDSLLGGTGNDTFYISDKNAEVNISDLSGEENKIKFTNINYSDCILSNNKNDLIIKYTNGNGFIKISDQLHQMGERISFFEFADGQIIAAQDLLPDLIISGSENDDQLYGSDKNDIIRAGQGNDQIYGNMGDDSIYGDAGDDYLDGGHGNDIYFYNIDDGSDVITDIYGTSTIKMGAGILQSDISFSYSGKDLLININSTGQTITVTSLYDWQAGQSTNLKNIEFNDGSIISAETIDNQTGRTLIFGQPGGQTLTGSASDDLISGGTGDDIISSANGNDALYGGDGNDIISGQNGADLIFGDAGNDTISGGEGNDALGGNRGNDSLAGDSGNDFIYGGSGDDIIDGGSGDDALVGGSGNDTYLFGFGSGIDVISEHIIFSELNKLANYQNSFIEGVGINEIIDNLFALQQQSGGGVDIIKFGIGITLDNVVFEIDGTNNRKDLIIKLKDDQGNLTGDQVSLINQLDTSNSIRLSSLMIEKFQFTDGTILTFSDVEKRLQMYGTSFDDSLSGSWLNDNIYGLEGNDTIGAGKGDDIVYGAEGNDIIRAGEGNDTLYGGEDNDTLEANNGNNTLIGGRGNDIIKSGSGNDSFIYNLGDGNDTIKYASQNDVLKFTNGILSTDIKLSANNVDLIITITSTNSTLTIKNYFAPNSESLGQVTFDDGSQWTADQLKDIVINGTPQTETIEGSFASETVYAADGDDIITGNRGNDKLHGQAGNDWIDGGSGQDYIYGGTGNDTIYADNTFQDTSNNYLFGQEGNDSIYSTNYGSIIDGGSGNDLLYGGSARDIFNFGDNFGQDTIYKNYNDLGPNSISQANDIINFNGNISADDLYFSVTGSTWKSLKIGILGSTDSITYKAFFADLKQNPITAINFSDGSYLNIANIYSNLSQHLDDNDNTLLASAFSENIYGYAGNDHLLAQAGDDSIYAGDGNDSLFGEQGNDTLYGELGDDSLTGGTGNDTFVYRFGDGHDTILDAESIDLIKLKNINKNDVKFSGSSVHLVMTFKDGGTLTVNRFYEYSNKSDFNVLLFDDGNYITSYDLNSLLIYVTDVDDQIEGSNAPEEIHGLAGNDRINGNNAKDLIYGDDGDDNISGGDDDDVLYGGEGNDTISGNQSTSSFGIDNDYIDGGAGDDILYGNGGHDTIIGGSGNDKLYANSGDNILNGGTGNDTLYGDTGNDSFVFNSSWGQDIIYKDNYWFTKDGGGNDKIVFKDGITKADLTFSKNGEDLIITHKNGIDKITVKDHFFNDSPSLMNIEFADGSTINGNQIEGLTNSIDDIINNLVAEKDIIQGTDGRNYLIDFKRDDTAFFAKNGNDYIYDKKGNDVIIAGKGNDRIINYRGSDTYIFNRGDGKDIIHDYDYNDGSLDKIIFTKDIVVSDIETIRSGHSLILKIKNTEDSITISNWFWKDNYKIETIEFIDGTKLTAQEIDAMTPIKGTNYKDYLNGTRVDDVIYALAGNDYIFDSGGDDTIIGGKGNDRIFNYRGNDTYVFNKGDGKDTIYESTYNQTENDSIIFGTGISSDNLIVTKKHGDLTLSFLDSDDQITIKHWYNSDRYKIEKFVFANGEILTNIDLESMRTIRGTNGNDRLYGQNINDKFFALDGNDKLYDSKGDDWFNAGKGDDSINDYSGNDTYIFSNGDGTDKIFDKGSESLFTDTVIFDDTIQTQEISLFMDNKDLLIGYGSGDSIRVEYNFYDNFGIEKIEAEDKYISAENINKIVQEIAAFGQDNGIDISSLDDVNANSDLMQIVYSGWQDF